jgi:hypothetical protein
MKAVTIPDFLYHATYKPLLKSIQLKGLGNTTKTFWDDSKPGVVYLASDPDTAISYAESAETIPDSWYDKIICLKIDTNSLNLDNLYIDENNQSNNDDVSTWEYHDIIPYKDIDIV